jgi:hypothetical protein
MKPIMTRGDQTLYDLGHGRGAIMDPDTELLGPPTSIASLIRLGYWEPIADAVTKSARTLTISSGGKARDDALNPIVARVRAQLIALVAEHSNRNKRDVSDEERDEHGEWTAGGGSLTSEEFTARTGIRIEGAKKLNPQVAGPVLARLANLQDRFHTTLTRINATRDPQGHPEWVAVVHPIDPMDDHSKQVMELNTRFFGGTKDPFKQQGDWLADSSLIGQATHEFGHAVASTMGEKGSPLGDALGHFYEQDWSKSEAISFYAQKNSGEATAEAFVHYINGTKSDNPTVAALGSLLDHSYPVGGKKVATLDSAPDRASVPISSPSKEDG